MIINWLSNLGLMIASLIWCSFDLILNRFFVIHFILALFIGIFIIIHVLVLHSFISFNPFINSYSSHITSFFPFLLKDIFIFLFIVILLSLLLLLEPDFLGNYVNQSYANPLVTPIHILPEWYFLVIYAILRSFPSKIIGVLMVILMFLLLRFKQGLNCFRISSNGVGSFRFNYYRYNSSAAVNGSSFKYTIADFTKSLKYPLFYSLDGSLAIGFHRFYNNELLHVDYFENMCVSECKVIYVRSGCNVNVIITFDVSNSFLIQHERRLFECRTAFEESLIH